VDFRGPLIAFLLIPTLAAGDARDCPEAYREADNLLRSVPAVMNAVATFEPLPEVAPSPLPGGGFRTRHGIRVDASCMTHTTPAELDRTLGKVLSGVARCGNRRGLSSVQTLLYDVIRDGASFSCVLSGCPAKSAACATQSSRNVNFRDIAELGNPGTWFHELLHLGGADNQCTASHNAGTFTSRSRDEVYFWETACFDVSTLLQQMRGDPAICANALRTNELARTRFSYNARSIAGVCSIYSRYLKEEKTYLGNVKSLLVPEIFACSSHLDEGRCPAVGTLNGRLRAAGLASLELPGPQNYIAWMDRACGMYSSQDQLNPALSLQECSRRLLSEGNRNFLMEKVAAGLLTQIELDDYLGSLRRMELKARFLSEGPANANAFPGLAESGKARQTLGDSIERCASVNGLKGTSLCRLFQTQMRRPMASLLHAWE
jgi:hypothetical protein